MHWLKGRKEKLRVLILLGFIFVLTACTPDFIHKHPGEAAARVGSVSRVVKSAVPIHSAELSLGGETAVLCAVWNDADSIFQFQPFFGDAKRQQPRQTIGPTLTPYGGARAEEYSIEKPEERNLQAGSSPSRSVPEPRKTVITAVLAPHEGNQRQFLPFRNDPPLTRFCAVQVQEGMRPGRGSGFQDIACLPVRKVYSAERSMDRYWIMRSTSPAALFPIGALFQFASVRYFQVSIPARSVPEMVKSLPAGEDFVIVWRTGSDLTYGPHSNVPSATFGTSPGAATIAAQSGDNSPTREVNESKMMPVEHQNSIGDLVISWFNDLTLWLVIYGIRAPPLLGGQIS